MVKLFSQLRSPAGNPSNRGSRRSDFGGAPARAPTHTTASSPRVAGARITPRPKPLGRRSFERRPGSLRNSRILNPRPVGVSLECTEAKSPWARARRPGSSAPRASSPNPRSTRTNRWRTRGTTPTSPPTTSGSSPPRRRRPPGSRRWTRERAGSRCNPSAASTTSCRARITSTNPRSTPTSSPRTP